MIWDKEKEFEHMQTYLILLKYLYYERSESIVSDYHFDSAEEYTKRLQRELNIKENPLLPSNMVGFNEKSPYWEKAKNKYTNLI